MTLQHPFCCVHLLSCQSALLLSITSHSQIGCLAPPLFRSLLFYTFSILTRLVLSGLILSLISVSELHHLLLFQDPPLFTLSSNDFFTLPFLPIDSLPAKSELSYQFSQAFFTNFKPLKQIFPKPHSTELQEAR